MQWFIGGTCGAPFHSMEAEFLPTAMFWMVGWRRGGTRLGMDKAKKIRRYQQKDYSSTVEFPVEIIGRDGAIRRYSFEESIRLYQRRIASADLRYIDPELIQAEKQHCLSRIGQLRHSFFARYGWPAVEIVDVQGGAPGILAAEVAAFLRRCLANVHPEPEKFSFSQLDTAEYHRVYFVQPPQGEDEFDEVIDGQFLLYVFPFEVSGTSAARESFFDLVKVLNGVRITGARSVESMVAFFHTHDCGLILTGSGTAHSKATSEVGAPEEEFSWMPNEDLVDAAEQGMRMLGRGRFEEALEQFTHAYTHQHFRRVAYLGAAVVADQLGQDGEAETATVMGCSYFPGDPALCYHRAVNLMRQGRFTEALTLVEGIQNWSVGDNAVRFLASLCLLAQWEVSKGRAVLRTVDVDLFRMDPHLAKALQWVRSQQWARDALFALGVLVCLCGPALCAAFGTWMFLFLSAMGVVSSRLVMLSWHRQLVRQLSGPTSERMHLSSSAILIDGARSRPLV